MLEVCSLVSTLHATDSKVTAEPLLEHLRRLLLGPKGKAKEKDGHKSSAHESPNTRVLVLRCFAALPPAMWQQGLEEAHMGALMGGIDAPDSTTRREVSSAAGTLADIRHYACLREWTRTCPP